MDHRQLLRFLASGRVLVGGALIVAPGAVGGRWLGEAAGDPATKVFARALGVRDMALGVATIDALDKGHTVRTLTILGVACDGVDAAATLLATRSIALKRVLPVLAIAGTAAAVGALCVREVDEATA